MLDINVPSIQHPSCIKCGLHEDCITPFMEPSGVVAPNIIIVGEAPGKDEDKDGEPFVGRSGRLLRNTLNEVGVSKEVMFTNIVRCRPPGNKTPTKKTINLCKHFTIYDIDKHKPEQVWLMGGSPLFGVLGESGITSWNGVIVNKFDITYLPLFHPSYILRDDSHLDEWLEGMLKAVDGHEGVEKFHRIIPRTLDEIDEMYEFLSRCEYISYDTETSALDAFSAYSMILSVSFAGIDDDGVRQSYSLPLEHPESWWATEIPDGFKPKISEYEKVVGTVVAILHDHSGYLIGQNMKFDQVHTHAQLNVDYQVGGDTMLISHLIDSRPGIHGLKRLAGVHLGMYEYEQELTDYRNKHPEANVKRGGSYAFMPLDILLPYGAMDAEATLLLHDLLYEDLSSKQKILYDQLILSISDALAIMQINGFALDEYVARRYAFVYKVRQEEVFKEILADKKVKRMTLDIQKDIDESIKGTKRKRPIYQFNPASYKQKIELYYQRYKMPVLDKTATGNPTTKAVTLRPLETKYPILKSIRYYNLLNKMIGTYLVPAATGLWQSGDGKVRTNYNLHGTVTGRISSSDPVNLQNIPTPEKEPGTLLEILPIKNVFTHSYVNHRADNFYDMYKDGVIMSVDYSGAELRVFASVSDCQPMLDIHKSGDDFHTRVTEMMTGIPYDEVTKPVRYVYKWTNWTLLYGGDEYTLHALYDIPLREAEKVVKLYYKRFPEVLDYREDCVNFAEDHGYIESPFGRREWLPWINERGDKGKQNSARRSAVNMPVQSAASDTLLAALVVVTDKLKEGGYKAKTVNTVHDSMMLDVPTFEVLQVADLCVDIMENIQDYAIDYFPDVDFSWLKCPMKADVEVGTHYGTEDSLDVWKQKRGY